MGRLRVFLLWLTDLLCIYLTWFAVVWGYWFIGLGHYEPSFYLRVWPIGLVFTLFNAVFRLYHGSVFYPGAPLGPVEELRRLIGSAFVSHLLMVTYLAISYQTTVDYSRFVMIVAGVLTGLLSQPFRDGMRLMVKRAGIARISAVVYGSGKTARTLVRELKGSAYYGFDLVGYFAEKPDAGLDLAYLGRPEKLVARSRQRKADVLFFCDDERLLRVQMETFAKVFTHVEFVPTANAFPLFGSRLVAVGGLGGIEMTNLRRMKLLKAEKRILDWALSVLAFIVFLPAFVLVPILIKLTSRGPVFYRQDRLGREGGKIRVWKFRSMYVDADERLGEILSNNPEAAAQWNGRFKLMDDPRVTPLGRILRRTSIDELPQLFNVFAGEMSLVGPRPIVEEEVAYYGSAYPIFSSVLPGVTGLWQVSGRSDADYDRRVMLDVHYVLNWSPWMDIWVVLRTVFAVVMMRGAR